MPDISSIRISFPELSDIALLTDGSGQKEVYSAIKDGLPVVLKIVKGDSQDFSRFEREVAAVNKLSSSYIPHIYSHGTRNIDGKESYYLIEQRIDGQSYRDVLKLNPVQPITQVMRLAHVLLRACCDFEKCEIVHRDIKPENLLVDEDGKIWVIDFGIARHLDLPSLTSTADKFGAFTIGYAPPEQFRNNKPAIDSRADLFSIGVVLYESLSGTNPYLSGKHDIFEVIRSMESQDVTPLSETQCPDPLLSDFIECLMKRFPSRRPQSAIQALEWFSPIYSRINH